MTSTSQPAPSRAIEALGDGFYDAVEPASFPQATLRWRNDRAAAEIGLDALDEAEWVERFARFRPLDGSLPRPLALRYHGHQFRTYNPDLGDGRGFLYAQVEGADGRLMDLGTKGSGQTPWSRFGDGRLTLKGGVRELLATEMLEALGVRTSRTLSLVETGEALHRGDEPSPTRSAVLVRLSHGHVRIGTFERLGYLRDEDGLRRLVEYVNANLLPSRLRERPGVGLPSEESFPPASGRGAEDLLIAVVENTARLAASYMVAGFVHGVLNSDNINVTGESFDYGPWRFAPAYDPGFTAAYFDHAGLYAFGRQAEAILWDVMQLAVALRPLIDGDLVAILDRFAPAYRAHHAALLAGRLGVVPQGGEEDATLLTLWEGAMIRSRVPFDGFFFDWRSGRPRRNEGSYGDDFADLAAHLSRYETAAGALDHPYWADDAPQSMPIEEVEALWTPIAGADDWTPLMAKVAAVRRMGDAHRPPPA